MPQEVRQAEESDALYVVKKVRRGLIVAGATVAASVLIAVFGIAALDDKLDAVKPQLRRRFYESVEALRGWGRRQRRWYADYWWRPGR